MTSVDVGGAIKLSLAAAAGPPRLGEGGCFYLNYAAAAVVAIVAVVVLFQT